MAVPNFANTYDPSWGEPRFTTYVCSVCHCSPCICYSTVPQAPAVQISGPPYKCPVCEGRMTVPSGFYEDLKATDNTAREQCRCCLGRGVIWW